MSNFLKPNTGLSNQIFNSLVLTGGAGVHIFFVLSGFLITYLLLIEESKNGKVNVYYFYMRRVLRIWPLYYLIIVLGIYILPQILNTFIFEGNQVFHLFFLNNFDVVNSPVGIAWSVAIEEQFYLVWPLIFYLFRQYSLLVMSISLFLFSLIFSLNVSSFEILYYHTFSNIKFLMAGCIGAQLYFSKNKILLWAVSRRFLSLTMLLGLTFLLFILSSILENYAAILNLLLIFLYVLIIISLVVSSDNSYSFISKFGKYTYGMYLYHPTIILIFKIMFDKLNFDYNKDLFLYILMLLLCFIVTIMISIISFNIIEAPFLKMKKKFNPH